MVAQSLSSLLQRTTIDDHEEVLQFCNDVLAKSKSDLHAQHIKAVALLKLDRYEDSLRVIEAGGDALKKRAGLEYGYALYKCGKLDEAIEAVTQSGAGRGVSHLEAQVVWSPLFAVTPATPSNVSFVALEIPYRTFPPRGGDLRRFVPGQGIFQP